MPETDSELAQAPNRKRDARKINNLIIIFGLFVFYYFVLFVIGRKHPVRLFPRNDLPADGPFVNAVLSRLVVGIAIEYVAVARHPRIALPAQRPEKLGPQ